jgi:hypothetical protein
MTLGMSVAPLAAKASRNEGSVRSPSSTNRRSKWSSRPSLPSRSIDQVIGPPKTNVAPGYFAFRISKTRRIEAISWLIPENAKMSDASISCASMTMVSTIVMSHAAGTCAASV